eukprot:5229855-Amphidinium_carterae.1
MGNQPQARKREATKYLQASFTTDDCQALCKLSNTQTQQPNSIPTQAYSQQAPNTSLTTLTSLVPRCKEVLNKTHLYRASQ